MRKGKFVLPRTWPTAALTTRTRWWSSPDDPTDGLLSMYTFFPPSLDEVIVKSIDDAIWNENNDDDDDRVDGALYNRGI